MKLELSAMPSTTSLTFPSTNTHPPLRSNFFIVSVLTWVVLAESKFCGWDLWRA